MKVFTLALLLAGFSASRVQAGYILRVFYDGIPGTAVSDLTGASSFPNGPNLDGSFLQSERLSDLFEGLSSSGYPPTSNGAENYGDMIRGYIEAPLTGEYYFWIASADSSELWLSTNHDPANKKKIAFVNGTVGFREWEKTSDQKSAAVQLVAGQEYYVEVLHKAGTGKDYISVGWQLPDGTQQRPISAQFLQPYQNPSLPDPSFIVPPKNTTVTEGSVATFFATVNASFPVSYMWMKNGVPMLAETLSSLSTQVTLADNGTVYNLIVGNGRGILISDPAVLTVVPDTTAPALVSASSTFANPTQIKVVFSEAVDSATATLPQFYVVDGQQSATAAVMGENAWTVYLTVPALAYDVPHTLSGVGILDLATVPNAINPNIIATFTIAKQIIYAIYENVGGTDTNIVLSNAKYKDGTPDRYFLNPNAFSSPGADLLDNYIGQLQGFLVPPTDGDYTFYVYGDDGVILFLSTDANPANKQAIAGHNGWTGQHQYLSYASQKSQPITLQGGSRYYIEAVVKEGGGGDSLGVAWLKPGQTEIVNGDASFVIPVANIEVQGPVILTSQPAPVTVVEGRPATFSVGGKFLGLPPFSFQWLRNGAPIAGATGASFTIPNATFADGQDTFQVIVNNAFSSVTSDPATLTVTADNEAPGLVGAGSITVNAVNVVFNEAVDPATATTLANYSLQSADGTAVTISGVTPVNDSTVLLQTGDLMIGTAYQLTVQGVLDIATTPNLMGPTTVQFKPFNFQAIANIGNTQPFGAIALGETADIEGGGADIWGTSDGFVFVYTQVTGDFDYVVRLESLDRSDDWAKAGLMARSTLDAGSRHIINAGTPIYGLTMQYRPTTGGDSSDSPSVRITAEYPNAWLRLQRLGSVFYCYYSINGVDFTLHNKLDTGTSSEGAMPSTLFVGLAVTSHTTGSTTHAIFSDFNIPEKVPFSIADQPQNATVLQGSKATLTVNVKGTPPFFFQWQRDGKDISGATKATYTTPILTFAKDNGAKYRCVITDVINNQVVTTDEAMITVPSDIDPPSLVSVVGSVTFDKATLQFSEALDPATVVPGNFVADNGLTVLDAQLVGGDQVVLTTSAQTQGSKYVITISNVRDLVGWPLPASQSQASFTAFVFVSPLAIFEAYTDIGGGTAVNDLRNNPKYQAHQPDRTFVLNTTESPWNWADNYGGKLFTLLTPPITDDYEFYICSDDASELWISTDADPANLGSAPIASVDTWTNQRQWRTRAVQRSAPIRLEQGKQYYIEALIKEGGGGDGVGVAAILKLATAQGDNPPGETADRAFDRSTSTKWLDFANATPETRSSWIQYRYGAGVTKIVTQYTITSANDAAERDPRDWKFYGVNPDGSMDLLDTQVGQTFSGRFTKNSYPISNQNAYIAYRLVVDSVLMTPSPANSVQISEIELLDAEGNNTVEAVQAAFANDSLPINSQYTGLYINPDLSAIDITQQPSNVTVLENRTATFSVEATGHSQYTTSPNYQWQRDGVDIPGATSASYTTPRLALADNGAQFQCVLAVPGLAVVSSAATLTVQQDLVPPTATGVAGLLGNWQVNVFFDEELDPVSATDLANYGILGGVVVDAMLAFDNKTVLLTVQFITNTTVQAAVSGVKDLAGNAMPLTMLTGSMFPFTSRDIGTQNPDTYEFTDPLEPGYAIIYNDLGLDVLAGGTDIWETSDGFHFVYQQKTGDFDLAVQVTRLDLANNWSKAGLMVREKLTGPSRNINAVVDPAAGANAYEANYRTTEGGSSANWGSASGGVPYPNAWLRFQRVGNWFVAYRGTDGVNWTVYAQAVIDFPRTAYLGIATTSHNNAAGGTTIAQYRNFREIPSAPLNIAAPPANTTALQGETATFNITVGGSSPYFYQWYKNGTAIDGATSAAYTTPVLTFADDNGAQYICVVSNLNKQVLTSSAGVLSINPDFVKPEVIAVGGTVTFSHVAVVFSEPVQEPTATDLGNYTVDGGLVIQSATLSADKKTVTLATSAQPMDTVYNLTVKDVKDTAGNVMVAVQKQFSTGIRYTQKFLTREYYADIGGGTLVSDLTSSASFVAGKPTSITILTDKFQTPTDIADNYGQKVYGLLIPPATGNYTLYISSDDDSQLFLSTDDNAANKGATPIASVSGWTGSLEWNKYASQKSAPIPLQAGKAYYIEALMKEGSGGDNLAVAAKLTDDAAFPDGSAPIPSQYFSDFVNPANARLEITKQPQDVEVAQGRPATFTIEVIGKSDVSSAAFQWQRDGVDIPGANQSSYTLAQSGMTDNGAKFRCVASLAIPVRSVTSEEATLTVIPDTVPPTVTGAAGLLGNGEVFVYFSEMVDPVSASMTDNYGVSGALVEIATLSTDGMSVVLTVSGLAGTSANVAVNNVKDVAGNPMPQVAMLTAPLSPMTGIDIGVQDATTLQFTDPLEPGATWARSAKDFDVIAGGSDYWGGPDGFHFTYEKRTGDFDVVLQVASMERRDNWTHAGLMVREDLGNWSRYINAVTDPSAAQSGANVWEMNYRASANGGSANVPNYSAVGPLPYPDVWVRLQRVGNDFTGYRSTDGVAWTKMATITQTYPATVYVGMATTAHNNNPGQATFVQYRNYGNFPYVPPTKIAWVSFHPADNQPAADAATAGFTEAPDVGYTKLLASNGYKVTRIVTSGTPDVASLNKFDLVIISRSVPSGDYQDPPETLAWNGLTAPTMIIGGYILRNSRLGYTTGGTIPDTVDPVALKVNNPAHAIFQGVALDANNVMVNPYSQSVSYNGTVQRGISVNTDPVAGNGTILATVGTAGDPAVGGMVIGEWQAGAKMATAAGDILGGHRLVFLTGSREQGITSQAAGIYNLTEDGAKLFLNAVEYLTP